MTPLVCRTWAPRGQTPVFYQRGGSYQKVSCMGALAVPPRRHRIHFYFRLHPDQNINTDPGLDSCAPSLNTALFFYTSDRTLLNQSSITWSSSRKIPP